MSNMSLRTRLATEHDAAAVAAVYAPYVRETAISFEAEPPTPEVMADRIGRTLETYPWVIATLDGDIAGYAYAGQYRERAAYRWTVEVSVYVSATHHRRGMAASLYTSLLDMLRRQGFRSAIAAITSPNPSSFGFHQAFGFAPVGLCREVGFKLGTWHDVAYWQRAFTDTVSEPEEPIPFSAFSKSLY